MVRAAVGGGEGERAMLLRERAEGRAGRGMVRFGRDGWRDTDLTGEPKGSDMVIGV